MKILVVDDHEVVRQGLRRLLSYISGATIFEAANLDGAAKQCEVELPDVIVLDLNLGAENGLDLVRRLSAGPLAARLVVLTMHADPLYAQRAFACGILGYVAKTSRPEELLTAVRRAAKGERYLDETLAQSVADKATAPQTVFDSLSGREGEILELLGQGKSMAEIAAILGVAYKTVANTTLRLRDKLGAKGQADLVRIAIEKRKH